MLTNFPLLIPKSLDNLVRKEYSKSQVLRINLESCFCTILLTPKILSYFLVLGVEKVNTHFNPSGLIKRPFFDIR